MPAPRAPRRPLEPESQELRRLIDACAGFVVDQIDSLPSQPSWDVEGAEPVAAGVVEPPPESGRDIGAVLQRLPPPLAQAFNTTGPRHLALIPRGRLPAAAPGGFLGRAVQRLLRVAAAAAG